jgi:mannose/fructose/N-acetylgalactosamine-specific phosphotransferase system component IIC
VRVLPSDTRTYGDSSQAYARLDYACAGLVTGSLAALIFRLSHGQQDGFTAPPTIAAIVVAVVLAALFVLVETRMSAPMLRCALLADRGRGSSYLAMLLMGGVTAGYVYVVSLYVQLVLGFSPVATVVALLPANAV